MEEETRVLTSLTSRGGVRGERETAAVKPRARRSRRRQPEPPSPRAGGPPAAGPIGGARRRRRRGGGGSERGERERGNQIMRGKRKGKKRWHLGVVGATSRRGGWGDVSRRMGIGRRGWLGGGFSIGWAVFFFPSRLVFWVCLELDATEFLLFDESSVYSSQVGF